MNFHAGKLSNPPMRLGSSVFQAQESFKFYLRKLNWILEFSKN